MRWAAGLVEKDDALGLSWMMQRIDYTAPPSGCRFVGGQKPRVQQGIQRDQADAGNAVSQERPAADISVHRSKPLHSSSVPGDGFVQVENRASDGGHRRHFGWWRAAC